MKVYAGIEGGFPNHRRGSVGCNTPPELLPRAMAYALDLDGVSAAVIGPYTFEQAIRNVQLARQYQPLAESDARPIKPERVVATLQRLLPEDAIVCADPGTPCPYFSAFYTIRRPGRHFITNRAHGALG